MLSDPQHVRRPIILVSSSPKQTQEMSGCNPSLTLELETQGQWAGDGEAVTVMWDCKTSVNTLTPITATNKRQYERISENIWEYFMVKKLFYFTKILIDRWSSDTFLLKYILHCVWIQIQRRFKDELMQQIEWHKFFDVYFMTILYNGYSI